MSVTVIHIKTNKIKGKVTTSVTVIHIKHNTLMLFFIFQSTRVTSINIRESKGISRMDNPETQVTFWHNTQNENNVRYDSNLKVSIR
jgi:hypothetical protein